MAWRAGVEVEEVFLPKEATKKSPKVKLKAGRNQLGCFISFLQRFGVQKKEPRQKKSAFSMLISKPNTGKTQEVPSFGGAGGRNLHSWTQFEKFFFGLITTPLLKSPTAEIRVQEYCGFAGYLPQGPYLFALHLASLLGMPLTSVSR